MRYKQQITRRIIPMPVELDVVENENRTAIPTVNAFSMSPDNNHNEISEKSENQTKPKCSVIYSVPESPSDTTKGLAMHSPSKILKTGGSANDIPPEFVKVATGHSGCDKFKNDDEVTFIDSSAVRAASTQDGINMENGGREQVPPLPNGLPKDNEELIANAEYFIRCPQCQKGCQTFLALKEHMKTSHSDLTTTSENGTLSNPGVVSPTPTGSAFACTQCTSTFATKDQLEKHELLHSPNAQVSCKICNKTFANVYRLQRHMISHDESAVLRKFKCTECDKAFKFKHHLKEHIRIHSGEKPFECGNCGKRFSHSGSYSSHMTSKKCLVMNLKLGRTRAPPTTSALLDKNTHQNLRTLKRSNVSPLNNNIATSPNHNAYLPILPKYSEAAAAFLQSSLSANPNMSPFYLTPPTLLNSTHALGSYPIPSLGQILDQLQQRTSPPRSMGEVGDKSDVKQEVVEASPKAADVGKSNDSSCGDLIMDEENSHNGKDTDGGDLEAVKRILETVNASVTKQFLHANMQKFSSESSNSDCHSIISGHSPNRESMTCSACKKPFESIHQMENHDCESEMSEGLAAKLEEAVNTKSTEDIPNGNISGPEDQEYEKIKSEYDMDCESVTTTDHLSEDGRKVRVRSLISDEQLKILKDNYALNPRPKREELEKIASIIGFPVRVVQVWFQNTRARDRREGRLIQVPYSPTGLPQRYPSNIVPCSQPLLTPIPQSHYISEQPLDLSTKKSVSNESSPVSSPPRPPSINQHSEHYDEVVNLSRKSKSPIPYLQYPNYQNSNSSEPHRATPSPIDFNNSSRLAQILAQPSHKFSLPGMGLVPIDHLMHFGAADLPSLSQLINNKISCLSPTTERRCDSREAVVDAMQNDDDVAVARKRSKMSPFFLKTLGSPVLGNQEAEIEGQFICDQCDKSFSKQSSLARHKYEHSGQRPHKCNECPKAFKHKHHLTEHKRLHSGEKPFQCKKCLKRFSHSGSFSQHMNHRFSYCKPYRE